MKFDAILFGNGLTLCYQNQIQDLIPEKYKHTLYFDGYIDAIVGNSITPREENNLKKMFKSEYNYSFDVIKKELSKVKNDFCKGYEWTWGKILTDPSRIAEYKIVIDIMPVLYNLWYCNLKSLIYDKLDMQSTADTFAQSFLQYLSKDGRIFTTNFDGLLDSLCPEHIHGHFVEDLSTYRELIWHERSKYDFDYPFIWAPAEVGKMNMIRNFQQIKDCKEYFNFDFFSCPFHANNMLVFGMSFAEAGYMEGLEEYDSKYRKFSFGSCIDDHIIIRLKTLLEKGCLKRVYFAHYDDFSMCHYQKIIRDYELLNADVISSSILDLKVN